VVSGGEFGVVSSSLDDGVARFLASTKMLLVQLFFCHEQVNELKRTGEKEYTKKKNIYKASNSYETLG
jgi:hypothetical protein